MSPHRAAPHFYNFKVLISQELHPCWVHPPLFPSGSYLQYVELKCGCYLFKISFLPKLGGNLDAAVWNHLTLHYSRTRSCFFPLSSMRCLYPPFAVHKHKLLNLLSPGKSWRSNKSPGSYTGVCKLRAPHCWEPGSSLQQPHNVLVLRTFQPHFSEFIFLLSYVTKHRTSRSDPTRCHILLLLVSQSESGSQPCLYFLTLHTGPKQDVWSGAGRSHPAFHPLHMVLSAWKLFWRL